MKKIFKYITVVSLAGLTLSSCNLDIYPEAQISYDEDKPYFELEADVEGAHNTVYTYFRSTCGGSMAYLSDLEFQGFNAKIDFGNRAGSIHRTDDSFTASDTYVEGIWSSYYTAISRYNVIIAAADKVDSESELYAHAQFVKAEALIARAHSYLQLARYYAPAYDENTAAEDPCVPLVLVYDQNARPARNTNAEVYAQIAKDLEDARVIFEQESSDEWVEDCAVASNYFTTDVISFLQARVLLDTGDYQAAADTAAAIIGRGLYSLSADAAALANLNTKDTGTEAIMQCFSSLNESPNGYSVFIGYSKDKKSPTADSYQPDFIPSKVLIDSYESSDYRRSAWYELSGTASPLVPVKNGNNGAYYAGINIFSKYKGNSAYSSSNVQNGACAAKPYLISELYLIAAEGYLEAGNTSNANKYLSQLQHGRGASTTAANAANIQKEWFRETIGEGLYLSCLKRWHTGTVVRTAQAAALSNNLVCVLNGGDDSYQGKVVEADGKEVIWPIPSYEIRCNSNLEQNKEWK